MKEEVSVNASHESNTIQGATISNMDLLGFFTFGLINNTSYVIMIAGAKEIDPSVVGLVYLCSIIPSLLIKITGPYWYHLLSYRQRIVVGTFLMAGSFATVAIGGPNKLTGLQLLGVTMGAAQSGLGEASFLALSSFYTPSRKALTAWSSGTGMAGIIGYGWVVMFTQGFKATFATTLWAALCVFPLAYFYVFEVLMGSPNPERLAMIVTDANLVDDQEHCNSHKSINPILTQNNSCEVIIETDKGDSESNNRANKGIDVTNEGNARAAGVMNRNTSIMTFNERFHATLQLWPYMVPLFTVYAAEYTLQSGVWSAMGFPITDSSSRTEFYEYSNWVYQAGVLCSRSSGTLWTPTKLNLWIMPTLQCIFLIFSIYNAYHQLWYDWSILLLCFCVGLLGGAVYVGGFSLVAMESEPHMKEFNLSAASVGDSFGISLANVVSIALQKAIYSNYGIKD